MFVVKLKPLPLSAVNDLVYNCIRSSTGPWDNSFDLTTNRHEITIYYQMGLLSDGARRKKTCLWEVANNKGAYQPAHPCRLIKANVIHFLESIIFKLATGENSFF